MNAYTLRNIGDENSFIDVYNWGSFIIRYTGVYFSREIGSRFCTLPIFPLDHIRTTFPDDADGVEAKVQLWLDVEEVWKDFTFIVEPLPRGYCFRTSGTIMRPSINEILCPDFFSCK